MIVSLTIDEIVLISRALDCLIGESPKSELNGSEVALYDKFINLEIEAHK